MNKRGITEVFKLFGFIFMVFFLAVFLGIAVWGFSLVNENLDLDVDIGQVNLKEVNEVTFGAIATAFINNADMIGIMLILGMAVVMMISAYFFGDGKSKLWFIIDIFILIFVFMAAVYISQTYEKLTDIALLNVFVNDIPKVSKFLLNLPLVVSTIGALLMILSYSKLKKDKSDQIDVAGF